jgi:anti-anti-sigma regulatory factor
MTTNAVWLPVEDQDLAGSLRAGAAELVKIAEGEVLLDFSSVPRIGSGEAEALRELTELAEKRAVKLRMRNVNVRIYKALALLKLARRLSFSS